MTEEDSSSTGHSVGDVVRDKQSSGEFEGSNVPDDEKLVVTSISDETIAEFVCSWDSKMEPITVADMNPNTYDDDELSVGAVYVSDIKKRLSEWSPGSDIEEIRELIEKKRLKEWHFPESRLESIS